MKLICTASTVCWFTVGRGYEMTNDRVEDDDRVRWCIEPHNAGYRTAMLEDAEFSVTPGYEPVVQAVSDDIGDIRVGRLPTMNQDDYPGLGDWWVQLRIGEDFDEVLARVYGATPQEANNRAEALACRAAMLNQK